MRLTRMTVEILGKIFRVDSMLIKIISNKYWTEQKDALSYSISKFAPEKTIRTVELSMQLLTMNGSKSS